MLWRRLAGASSPKKPIEYVGGYVQGFAGTTSDVTISLTSLTGGIATSPAADDFVIVYFGTGAAGAGSISDLIVSNYTELFNLYGSDTYDTNLAVAYKRMGATPDTTFTLSGGTRDSDDAGAVAVQVWRNVNVATPFDVTSTATTGSNSVLCDPPEITPITAGAYIVAGGAGAHDRGTQTYSSSDLSGFRTVGRSGINDVTIGLGYKEWTSGSFNPAAFTFSGPTDSTYSWAAVTLALRPA